MTVYQYVGYNDNLYICYNPVNMDNTFIKGDNMEYLELNRSIREAKTKFILDETEDEAYYYKSVLKDLRTEKRELMNKFNRSC